LAGELYFVKIGVTFNLAKHLSVEMRKDCMNGFNPTILWRVCPALSVHPWRNQVEDAIAEACRKGIDVLQYLIEVGWVKSEEAQQISAEAS
jgi:hypothetical protein